MRVPSNRIIHTIDIPNTEIRNGGHGKRCGPHNK